MKDDYTAFSGVSASVGLLFVQLTKSVIQCSEYLVYFCGVGLEVYVKGLLLKYQINID